MKRFLVVLSSLMFVTACGEHSISDVIINPRILVDPTVNMKTHADFIPYVALFERYHKETVKVPVIYDNADHPIENEDHAAVCIKNFSPVKSRYIVVRKSNWDKLSRHGKESLMFHELGHCVLDLEHEDEMEWVDLSKKVKAKYPVSFMSSRHWLGERPNRETLIERMFNITIDTDSEAYKAEMKYLNQHSDDIH